MLRPNHPRFLFPDQPPGRLACSCSARAALLVLFVLVAGLAGCAKDLPLEPPPPPAETNATQEAPYCPPPGSIKGYLEEGLATYYGNEFHGRRTSCGEKYDKNGLTAAHRLLPMGSLVRVTNLANNKSVEVRINDRGMYFQGHIIDLSREAAKRIDMLRVGVTRVRLEGVGRDNGDPELAVPGRFFVQVDALPGKKDAETLSAALRARGFGDTRIKRAAIRGKVLWRVQAGSFAGLAAAQEAQKELSREYPLSFVIPD